MKDNANKKTLIVLRNGQDTLIINPSDLKFFEVVATGNGISVTIQTSVFRHTFRASQYLVDKLRGELRSRYNLITVASTGASTSGNTHKNDIVIAKDGDSTTYIFPKGLKAVESEGQAIVIHAFRKTITVALNRPVNPTDLTIFSGAKLEAAVETVAAEET